MINLALCLCNPQYYEVFGIARSSEGRTGEASFAQSKDGALNGLNFSREAGQECDWS